MSGKVAIAKELFDFLWKERLWWMVPFVVTLLSVGFLIVMAQSSPVLPFLYAAF